MISVLGMEAAKAKDLLESQGAKVELLELSSKKGLSGNETRVIRQRLCCGRVILTVSSFQTEPVQ